MTGGSVAAVTGDAGINPVAYGEHPSTQGAGEEPVAMSESLAELRSDVAATAADIRTAYFTFLTAGLYLAITVGATTHEELLSGSRVALPLTGVALPVLGFYVLAPALFLILHFNLLLQFRLLAGKARSLNAAIDRLPIAGQRAHARALLPAFPFVQMVAGRPESRLDGSLLRLTIWLTVVWAPALLLLETLVRFLPYHSAAVTWWHRGLILVELMLLWLLWPGSLWRRSEGIRQPNLRESNGLWRWLGLGQLSVLLLACLAFATLPGETLERHVARILPGDMAAGERTMPWPTWWLLEHPESPLARNLRLHETSLVGEIGEQTPTRRLDLRKRDLRYAELTGADLRQADLRNATLDGAMLSYAHLDGALLSEVRLEKADLRNARLKGASLHRALLKGADLGGAHLEGANLARADLEGADLTSAWLLAADLQAATLTRATLRDAHLWGADLGDAVLCEAILGGADLTAANLRGASIADAALTDREDPPRSLAYADLRLLKAPAAICLQEPRPGFGSPPSEAPLPSQPPPPDFECGLADRLISLMENDLTGGAITIAIGHRILRREIARHAEPAAARGANHHAILTAAALVENDERVQRLAQVDPGALEALRALAQMAHDDPQACAGAGDQDEIPIAESALRWQPQPSATRPDRRTRSAPGRSSES
jgi:uncharacterized protein YjbI with pentapeptide repeats